MIVTVCGLLKYIQPQCMNDHDQYRQTIVLITCQPISPLSQPSIAFVFIDGVNKLSQQLQILCLSLVLPVQYQARINQVSEKGKA